MLEAITWKEYLVAVTLFVIGYYLIISLLFFRKEMSVTITEKLRPQAENNKDAGKDIEEEQLEEKWLGEEKLSEENLFDELEEIVTDIRHNILEKAGKEADKDMLLLQLKSRVANYNGLGQPAYRVALNNFIIHHAESICGIVYSKDELDNAWDSILQ
ncbi:hypothetical protein [Pedobacter panaciterrae]